MLSTPSAVHLARVSGASTPERFFPGLLVMSTLLSEQQWLADLVFPLLLIGVGVLIGFTVLYISAQSRRSSLVRHRSGRTEETFAENLAEYGFDPELARATYRYLQGQQNVAFPIEPFDDLDCDLGLDSEDLSEAIRALLAETGRIYLPGLLDSPLVTVEDLVRTIQASPRREKMVA